MTGWKDYASSEDGTASQRRGRILMLSDVRSPQLGNRRDLLVYLPAAHGTNGRRFPVLYMQDGQNLFDAATSFAGEWGIDRALDAMHARGGGAIVVGVPNKGMDRIDEYSPFVDEKGRGGKGEAYVDFLLETVRPLIESEFDAAKDRASAGIFGSSLGGLISLYAFFRRPESFGFAGAMSPSLWFAGRAIFPWLEAAPFVPGRLYIDAGTLEGPALLNDVAHLRDLLIGKGYRRREVMSVIEKGGRHNEQFWGARFTKALRFLLRGHGGHPR